MTDKPNQSKNENQSLSFSSFNHEGQLQRAVDEITTTQTTKASLQRIVSSPSFYCHLVSLSVFSLSLYFLSLFISLFSSAISLQSRIIHAGVFPASYKENLGMNTLVIPPTQIEIRPAVFNSISEDWTISLWCDVLTQL